MNNAFFEEENKTVIDTSLEEARLSKLIEAINELLKFPAWHDLQDIHFSQEKERIERLMLSEAKSSKVNTEYLRELQGELKWAIRYADIRKWAQLLQHQLSTLKKKHE